MLYVNTKFVYNVLNDKTSYIEEFTFLHPAVPSISPLSWVFMFNSVSEIVGWYVNITID